MVDSTVDSTLDNAEWLSLADAARTLGVSEKTARRRAKAGQLEARQVSTQHGPAWQVRVPTRVDSRVDTKSRVDSTVPMGTQAQPADVAALVGLVDRLTAENRELVNAVAAWQSQAVVLAGRLADAEERLALTAPSTPVEASTAPAAAQAAPGGASERLVATLARVAGRRASRRGARVGELSDYRRSGETAEHLLGSSATPRCF